MGYQVPSPFLKLNNFNPITGILPEGMHLLHSGILKKLLSYTIMVDTARKGMAFLTRRMPADIFDEFLTAIKVPSEFHRAPRKMMFHKYKAIEFRNLGLILFPIILK